jgi:hypothetical protein
MTRSLYCALFLLLAGTAAHAQFRAIRETNFKKVYVDSTLWVNYLQSASTHYAMVVYDSIDKQIKSVPPSAGGGGTGTNQPITWTGSGDVSGTATGTTSLTPSLSLSSIITAGTIGGSTQIPIITYDAKGRITSVSSTGISGANGGTVTSVGVSSPDLTVSGSPVTGSGTISLTLPDINPNLGTFNTLIVNAKGQVTGASNTPYLTSEFDPDYNANGVKLAGAQTLTGVKTFPAATPTAPSIVVAPGSAYGGTTTGATWINSNHIYTYLNGGAQQLDNQASLGNVILNQTTPQPNASYNIDGTGVIGGASNLTTTLVAGLTVRDTSAAISGEQNSPLVVLEGQGRKTNATATSQPTKIAFGVTPVSGATNARSNLNFYSNTTTGAWNANLISTPIMTLSDVGSLTTANSIVSGGSVTTSTSGAVITQNIFDNNGNIAFWRTNAGDRNVTFFREGNVLIQPGGTHNNGDVLLQVARPTTNATLANLTTHAGADTIFSSNVLFSLTNNFRVGDTITINGETKTIASITSATVMRANSVFTNTNTNTSAFSYSAVNGLSVKANGSVNLDNGRLYTDMNGVYEKFRTMSADPTTSDIPAGYCQTVWNSTTSTLKRWCNVGGTMHSVTIP